MRPIAGSSQIGSASGARTRLMSFLGIAFWNRLLHRLRISRDFGDSERLGARGFIIAASSL